MGFTVLKTRLPAGGILGQLRYLAEKDHAVRLFCSEIVDPENLSELVSAIEDDPFQDKLIVSSIVDRVVKSLCSQ